MIKNNTASFLWMLIFCFATMMAYSQNNLQKYYEYINKAELAICRENYEEAGEFYKQAFAEFPPFGRDLFFASTLNYKYLHNDEEALKYAYILQQMNEGIAEYFLNDDEKEEYPNLQKQLEIMQDTIKVLVIPELKEALEKLHDADQKPRRNYLEDYPEDENYENYENRIRIVDSVNLLELKALYQKYGEINERNAGRTFHRTVHIVLLHNTSWSYNLDNVILKEVMKGNFDARIYIELKDRYLSMAEDTSHYALSCVFIIHNTLFLLLAPEEEEFVNRKRKEINIAETWDDYKEKVLHRFYQKNYDFRLCNIQRLSWGSDEKDEKQMNVWKSRIDSGEVKGSYYTKE